MSPDKAELSDVLAAALGGDGPVEARGASALRLRCRLQPAGGPGAKLMPPTYSGTGGDPTYIEEERRIGDESFPCVLLDGVASQANRLEAALSDSVNVGDTELPSIQVDQKGFGTWSGLDFSHRCFDAWIEDAELEGHRFGETELFKRLASTTRHNVTALMEVFPVGIILGCWASRVKNPQGTTRLARIIASEIIAVNAVKGARPGGKIDRHHVSGAIDIFLAPEGSGERLTLDEDEAARDDKGKARRFPSKQQDQGKPSAAGYGNVTPSLAKHGGITMDHGLQIATISLPALRECRFPTDDDEAVPARDLAGRKMLTALALRMLALQLDRGYDLRSGCLLVPEEEPTVELVGRLGTPVASWPLITAPVDELLGQAVAEGGEHGLRWDGDDLRLVASDTQLELLRRSLAQDTEAAA